MVRSIRATASTSGSSGMREPDSRCWLQREFVTFRFGFGRVAEGLNDWLAFKPVGKLVGIVATAGLAAFAAGDQENRIVPIGDIGYEAHRGAMAMVRGSRAEACTGL